MLKNYQSPGVHSEDPRKGRLSRGETVALFGTGGLGVSAVQLARALGAREVFAVDIRAADPADLRAVAAIIAALPGPT